MEESRDSLALKSWCDEVAFSLFVVADVAIGSRSGYTTTTVLLPYCFSLQLLSLCWKQYTFSPTKVVAGVGGGVGRDGFSHIDCYCLERKCYRGLFFGVKGG